jgi:DNA polymerase-3 subunit beta
MEIAVRTTEFARVLRLVQSLADRKNTVPVLGTLLIRADAKGLTITGTDMELGGISYCPAAIRATGSVAIPAQRLSDYVRMLPDSELVLKEQNSGWVSLTCGRSRSRIATLSPENFPELPKPPREGASFSAGILARLIEKAPVAVSSESLNTSLAGALLKIEHIDAQHGFHRWSSSGARDGSGCDSRAGKAGRRSDSAKGAGHLSAFC